MSGAENSGVQYLPLDMLDSYHAHPYHVPAEDDPSIQALAASIKENGVLTPAIAQKKADGRYELISGHRRKLACKIIGLDNIPVIVKEYKSEDAAMSAVIDANLHRQKMLPSEKAKVYRARYEILKHQGKAPEGEKGIGKTSLELIGKTTGESAKTVQRYISVSKLIDGFQSKLDNEELGLTSGVELSTLNADEQAKILSVMTEQEKGITLFKVKALKKLAKNGNLTNDAIRKVLTSSGQSEVEKATISLEDLKNYFTTEVKEEELRDRIISLLEQYGEKTASSQPD